jgi:hypothetical protein
MYLRFLQWLGFRLPLDQIGNRRPRLRQRLLDRRRIAQIGFLQRHRHHCPGVHVHRVLGLMGQVRAPVLHLGDARVRIMWVHPLVIRPLLFSLPIHPRQVFPCGSRDTRLLCQPFQEILVALSVIPPYDRTHRRVGLQRRGINSDPLALHQTGIRQQS